MFFNRRNALASGAMLASVALSGARAQTAEEESRLLIAVAAPKVVDAGGDSEGEGYATISFKTGPNLVSYDYTVSCYERNLTVPTTSCLAISEDDIPAAGNSTSGETGKAYSKITANVTGLNGDETYDCFIYTYGPLGYDKCKYIGSTDVGCFSAEPVTLEDTSYAGIYNVDDSENVLYSLELDYAISTLGNPAIAANAVDVLGFACVNVTGGAATCPASSSLLTVAFPDYPTDFTGSQNFTDATTTGSGSDAVIPNTAYTCYSMIVDSCDDTAVPACSDSIELVTVPNLAFGNNAVLLNSLFNNTFNVNGSITVTCGRDTDTEGTAEVVTNWWTCQGGGVPNDVWYPVDCAGDGIDSQIIPGYDEVGDTASCVLWQGQGPAGEGCSPYFPNLCTWYAIGNETTPNYASIWSVSDIPFPTE